ncbi:MAG: heme a synthase [Candidatus Binataceae bacterium]|nr:heme a synthase [Candidatus Binataceae bacterium]
MNSAQDSHADGGGSRALHRFAVICAIATFILIFVGGLVTSTGSALAVPDWPLAYGRLVPKLVGGVRFEYGHRVVASVVVMLTIVLATWIAMVERRSWVRKTAFAAAGVIVLQAILGGITVLYLLPLPVAVAHAGTAQALFCLMVAIVLFTNPNFGTGAPLEDDGGYPPVTTLATITTAIIYIQILIGAVMRHLGAGLAIPDFPTSFGHWMPPFFSLAIAVNFAHRCGAVVVSIFVLWTVARVFTGYRDRPALTHPALLLLALLLMQVTLGAMTIWSGRAVLPTTAHVAIGAAVLATSLALTIRIRALRGLASVAEAARVRSPISPTIERKVTA